MPAAPAIPSRLPLRDAEALTACRRGDRRGSQVHLACAVAMCLLVSWPTSIVELAGIPLILALLIRIQHTRRVTPGIGVQPHMLVGYAIAAWLAVTLAWSADRSQGLEELGAWRWLWVPIAVWPVIHRRLLLTRLVAWGFAAGIASQWLHLLGTQTDLAIFGPFVWDRDPARISGWWDPVVGGTLLVACLGLHMGLTTIGTRPARLASAIAVVFVLASIALTGTRGAMLAAGAVLLLGPALILARTTLQRRHITAIIVAGIGAAVLIAGVWSVHGSALVERVDDARAEVRAAIDGSPPRGDTAMRVRMAEWAIAGWEQSPVLGEGAGSFRTFSVNALEAEGLEPESFTTHDHAHSAIPHALFVGGLPYAALLTAMLWVCVVAGVRTGNVPAALGILGLCAAGVFDTIQLNAQTMALLFVFIALSPSRPPPTADAL